VIDLLPWGAMRCPHCAGEIPAGSRFWGICGRNITVSAEAPGQEVTDPRGWSSSAGAAGDGPELSMSLFELPTSRRARLVKVALVLALDGILAAAGIIMILSYLEGREAPAAGQGAPAAPAAPDVPAAPAATSTAATGADAAVVVE
jgi:hypothetical protein